MGFPGGTSGKESACQSRRPKKHRFDPWVRKIPCRRAWQPTPVLSEKPHRQRAVWRATVHRVTKSQTLLKHLWKIIKEMGIPVNLTCLLRNLYAGQATVRTGHGTTDWLQIGKGVYQGCILSPCVFNFCAEYIMRNTGLDEAQARIKIAERNINNLRYADDTTLRAESEEELKSFLMKVQEESEKVGLKLNIQKTKTTASSPITSWQIDRETVGTVRLYFAGGAPKSLPMVTAAMKLKDACSLEEKL